MLLRFTKMHGIGNDFVVIDAVTQAVRLASWQIRWLANRKTGIGCDQLLLVEPPLTPEADFRYRIFNGDGAEVEQCGNGARCFALFVAYKKLSPKTSLLVETKTRLIRCEIINHKQVRVDMGAPIFAPQLVPFIAPSELPIYQLKLKQQTVEIGVLSMGNPHAVLLVDDVDKANVAELGAEIEVHPDFPAKVNVGFLQIIDEKCAKLRVFERGTGETSACGSGACAAAVFAMHRGLLEQTAQIRLLGGSLTISWAGVGSSVMMTGPAMRVFEGQIKL